MNGTSTDVTSPMRLMPPRMTAAVRTTSTMPVTAGDDAEAGVQAVGHRVGLHHVADAEGGQRGQQANTLPSHGQAEALLQRVHRAAPHRARRVGLAVVEGDDDLGELGAHAEQARDPQPEQRAGPPRKMAVATPAMLPTPTVEASAVATAWNGETLPCRPSALGTKSLPSTSRKAKPSLRNCTAPVRIVSSTTGAHQQHDHRVGSPRRSRSAISRPPV
jgi:hypothetical protein